MPLINRLNHLSYSSISLFRNAPSVWCIKYLYGIRDEMAPAALRGRAIEAGLDLALMKSAPFEDCLDVALQNFTVNLEGVVTPGSETETLLIAPMLRNAIEVMQEHGPPSARQVLIEGWIEGVPIPIVGYADYLWPEAVVDLKTTKRMPSEPTPDHAMQVGGFYAHELKRTPFLLYTTPGKAKLVEIHDRAGARQDFETTARALAHALQSFEDPAQMTKAYAPDFTSFYWSEPTKAKAKEVYQWTPESSGNG